MLILSDIESRIREVVREQIEFSLDDIRNIVREEIDKKYETEICKECGQCTISETTEDLVKRFKEQTKKVQNGIPSNKQ